MIELVLGGTRSGKSRYAEKQAIASAKEVVYIATAKVSDGEMQQRIDLHRQQRLQHWKTVEESVHLAGTIKKHAQNNNYLLVDCLTLWLSNIMFDKNGEFQQQQLETEKQALLDVLVDFSGHIILVTNELGLGLVAMDKMTRQFVDEAGLLHQQIAALSDKVVMVTAGLPQRLK